ncbi:hypothetical protein NKJ73_15070 [Mesorhizobium sp. M0074]|uniref:hypothetical protein n=1 Tax=unclassified Mesorhizobium TaxID=325217 RepID=UPI003334B34E
MASDHELFANGLAANQKVIEANYMAHREALWPAAWSPRAEGPGRFVFADLACGTGPFAVRPVIAAGPVKAAVRLT